MRVASRLTSAVLLGAALAACARAASSPVRSETMAVSSVAASAPDVDHDASRLPKPRDASDVEARVLDAITVRAPHERTITREGLALLLEHQNALMGSIATVPDFDGSIGGIRLEGIGAGSVVAQLGFEDGDRIDALNGKPLTVETAVEAYASLRDATYWQIDVWRRGAPTRLVVVVR